MQGDFSQLGFASATLGILWFIVRYFITAIEKKDDQIQKITAQFTQTIGEHLTQSREANGTMLSILTDHTKVLSHHTEVLSGIVKSLNNLSGGRRMTDTSTPPQHH